MTVCRWGILSTAEIGQKNWQAILEAPSADLIAVASRDLAKANKFVNQLQTVAPYSKAPLAMASYEELVNSELLDAAYLPLPTGIRADWAIRCAEAGKHVLIEKPAAIDATQLQRVIDACSANHVQLMDGVMFMHSARLAALRDVIDDGKTVGDIRHIASAFSFGADEEFHRSNIRADVKLEPHGCLGDLGWYNIRFILWAMNWQMPKAVSGRKLQSTDSGVPLSFSCEMIFEDVFASFFCSFLTDAQQWVSVSGTQGHLRLDDFVLPFVDFEPHFTASKESFDIDGCDFTMRRIQQTHAVKEDAAGTSNSQESLMIETFSQLALGGTPETEWAELVLKTQRVVDAAMQSSGEQGRVIELQSN